MDDGLIQVWCCPAMAAGAAYVRMARAREQRRLWRPDLRSLAAPAANVRRFRLTIPGRPSMRYR
jgi:hypothetical protein